MIKPIRKKSHNAMFASGAGIFLIFHGLSAQAVTPTYTDVTGTAGISHVMNATLDLYTGGAAAWFDYDNDGYDDLLVPNPNKGQSGWLYHNNKDGSFTEVAAQAGIQDTNLSGMGVAIGDYNGDGFDDIFIAHGSNTAVEPFIGDEPNALYKNNGDGTFTDVTQAANLHQESFNSMVASFGDIDGDGDLDLYVGNYLPQGNMSGSVKLNDSCEANNFYLNNGNGSFTEMATQLGIDNAGCALGAIMTDYDLDGDLDIYVTNDFTNPPETVSGAFFFNFPDTIYRNDGLDASGTPVFTADLASNLKDTGNGMGITRGDYDNDGDFDYYTSSFTSGDGTVISSVLNQNQLAPSGSATFLDKSVEAGVLDVRSANNTTMGSTIAWGVAFVDVDNDGYVDIYKADGCINGSCEVSEFTEGNPWGAIFSGQEQPNNLYMNNKDGTFTDGAAIAGVQGLVADPVDKAIVCPWTLNTDFTCYDQSRSVIVSDYDNDGDMDLFVLNGTSASRLYRNDSITDHTPADAQWLSLRLQGVGGNHRGIGARVRVFSGAGINSNIQIREISSGSGHSSTSSFAVHFGLGRDHFASQATVYWPSGCVQALGRLSSGSHTIVENCTETNKVVGRMTWNGVGVPNATIWDALRYPESITTTDAAGFFVLAGYNDGDYVFLNPNSSRAGFTSIQTGLLIQLGNGDSADTELPLNLSPGYLAGYMNLENGDPLVDTDIWEILSYPESITTTDTSGLYVMSGFEAGDFLWINPFSRGPVLNVSTNTSITNHDGSGMRGPDYIGEFKPNTISGYFHGADGQPLKDMTIWNALNFENTTVKTDSNGFFIMGNSLEGDYVFLNPFGGNSNYNVVSEVPTFFGVKPAGALTDNNYRAVPK